ncbi:MAG: hypothetical protein ACTHL3_02995 [Candidatus Nitrosocosmicus sp.]
MAMTGTKSLKTEEFLITFIQRKGHVCSRVHSVIIDSGSLKTSSFYRWWHMISKSLSVSKTETSYLLLI